MGTSPPKSTTTLTSSVSDTSRSGMSSRASFPTDPRAFDFSFAFNNPEFSDRVLVLEILDEGDNERSPALIPLRGCQVSPTGAAAPFPECSTPESSSAPGTRNSQQQDQIGEEPQHGPAAAESTTLAHMDRNHSIQNLERFKAPGQPALASDNNPSFAGRSFSEPVDPFHRQYQRATELHVISAILVSQSDFFRSLFSPQWSSICAPGASKRPAVTLKLSPEEEKPFLELMRFIYTGRISVEEDPAEVLQLLLVANKFGVLSCVNVCAHHLREVPLSLDICCVLLRVCSGVVLSEAASFLVASSAAFLVTKFGNLDAVWKLPEFLDLPLEALEAILGSDDVCVMSEETVFTALLHWVRHQSPDDLAKRKELTSRLAEKVRFPAMDTEALRNIVMGAPEADIPSVKALVSDALWFKCSSFERQQELVLSSVRQHRRFLRRRQLTIHSEVLLQDCYMLQPGQAILLSGGAWVCGKLFSLKVMRVAAPVGGSDFGLFLQASQRCPTQDKILDDSVSVEFSFKVKEWPAGMFVQQKQSASHTFKGLFRERGYRSLLSPWNEVMKDNNKFFRNGVMYVRADLRVIQPGESLAPFDQI